MVGNGFGDFLDVVGIKHFHTDREVAAEVDHRLQDIHRAGVPVDDGAADVVSLQQIENFFLTSFGVQIDEFFLFAGGSDKIFHDFSLRRIGRSIFDPVEIEAAASWVFHSY